MTLARIDSSMLLTPCSVTCWLAWSVSPPRQLPDRRKHAPCRWAERRRHRSPGLQQSAIEARPPQERVEVASAPWTVHGSALRAAADWNRHLKQATQPPQVRPARAPNGRPLSSRCRQSRAGWAMEASQASLRQLQSGKGDLVWFPCTPKVLFPAGWLALRPVYQRCIAT